MGLNAANDKQFIGLELLRFLCAFTVIVWHYQHFFWVNDGFVGFQREMQPLYGPLFVAYNWGNYAVEVFWAISGFIFFWKYAEPIRCGRTGGREFFVLRFSRLYPLHLVTLLAVLGLQTVYLGGHDAPFIFACNDLRHFLLNLLLASDWGLQRGLSFNGPVWSISVEILAYGLFFLLARRWVLGGRMLAGIIVGLIAAKILLPPVKDMVLCQLYFFVGGAIFRLCSRPQARPLRWAAMAGLVAAAFIAVNWRTDGKVHTFAVIAVSVALLLGALALGSVVKARRLRHLFGRLGNLTYSSYLLHFPLQLAIVLAMDHFGWDRTVFLRPETLGAFLLAVFVIAQASFQLFEHPVQEWLRARLFRASDAVVKASV